MYFRRTKSFYATNCYSIRLLSWLQNKSNENKLTGKWIQKNFRGYIHYKSTGKYRKGEKLKNGVIT
jgi:hypothetical protein